MKRLDNFVLGVLRIRGQNQQSFRVNKLSDQDLDNEVALAQRIMAAVDKAQPESDEELEEIMSAHRQPPDDDPPPENGETETE